MLKGRKAWHISVNHLSPFSAVLLRMGPEPFSQMQHFQQLVWCCSRKFINNILHKPWSVGYTYYGASAERQRKPKDVEVFYLARLKKKYWNWGSANWGHGLQCQVTAEKKSERQSGNSMAIWRTHIFKGIIQLFQ